MTDVVDMNSSDHIEGGVEFDTVDDGLFKNDDLLGAGNESIRRAG